MMSKDPPIGEVKSWRRTFHHPLSQRECGAKRGRDFWNSLAQKRSSWSISCSSCQISWKSCSLLGSLGSTGMKSSKRRNCTLKLGGLGICQLPLAHPETSQPSKEPLPTSTHWPIVGRAKLLNHGVLQVCSEPVEAVKFHHDISQKFSKNSIQLQNFMVSQSTCQHSVGVSYPSCGHIGVQNAIIHIVRNGDGGLAQQPTDVGEFSVQQRCFIRFHKHLNGFLLN